MGKKEVILQKTGIVWLGALLCCALWGSAFPCIKIGYQFFEISSHDTATQILFAGYRFMFAGLLTILIGSCMNRKLLIPKKQSWGKIGVLGLFQTFIQYLFFYMGLAHTTGVKASIVSAMNVFAAILIASLIFHQEKLSLNKIIGSVLGFIGVVLVNLTGSDLSISFNVLGEGAILISTISSAISSVLIKDYSKADNPITLSGYQFVVGSALMIVIGLIGGGRLPVITPSGLLMLAYLACVSAVAYSLWSILLKYNSVSKVTIFGFMNPVFGFFLSALLLNEAHTIGFLSLIALVLVCLGIYIVNKESSLHNAHHKLYTNRYNND